MAGRCCPDKASIAASTASTPLSIAARTVAAAMPESVMRVEMQRQIRLLAQGLEQDPRRGRLQQARHILDGDDMRARRFEFRGRARHSISNRISGAPASARSPV